MRLYAKVFYFLNIYARIEMNENAIPLFVSFELPRFQKVIFFFLSKRSETESIKSIIEIEFEQHKNKKKKSYLKMQ